METVGSYASILGLMVSAIGLGMVFLQAGKARSAAEAAKQAAEQARSAVARSLAASDLQSAIDIVQGIKRFQRDGKWEFVLEQYPVLRSTLADINARHHSLSASQATRLQAIIGNIKFSEGEVFQGLTESLGPIARTRLYDSLNSIQEFLEQIRSSFHMESGTGNPGG